MGFHLLMNAWLHGANELLRSWANLSWKPREERSFPLVMRPMFPHESGVPTEAGLYKIGAMPAWQSETPADRLIPYRRFMFARLYSASNENKISSPIH